jgi:hypothetical protein
MDNQAALLLLEAREWVDLIEICVFVCTSGIRNTLKTTLAIHRCVFPPLQPSRLYVQWSGYVPDMARVEAWFIH